jgi:hypothetical protein
MTDDDILNIARECGLFDDDQEPLPGHLIKFARAIAAQEREACIELCEKILLDRWNLYKGQAPYFGNETGRASPFVEGESSGAEMCAEAIRARSE